MTSVTYVALRELMSAHIPVELTTNGSFSSDTGWTKGAGWTIGSGVASAAAGSSSDLEQDFPTVSGLYYDLIFTVSGRTAGTITPKINGTVGTARNSNSTFTETIQAGSGSLAVEFTKDASFDGSIDNVSLMLGVNSYPLDINVIVLDRTPITPKTTHEALDGTSETLADDQRISYALQSNNLIYGSNEWLQWMEFLNSVREGETFTFDPTGTYAIPSAVNNAKLVGDWSEQRIEKTNQFFIQFNVKYGAVV